MKQSMTYWFYYDVFFSFTSRLSRIQFPKIIQKLHSYPSYYIDHIFYLVGPSYLYFREVILEIINSFLNLRKSKKLCYKLPFHELGFRFSSNVKNIVFGNKMFNNYQK